MKRLPLVVALVTLVAGVFIACAGPTSPATTPAATSAAKPVATPTASAAATQPAATPAAGATQRKPAGTLTVLLNTLGTERFMPQLGALADQNNMQGVYETLLYTMPGSSQPLPGLAERWEVSPDRKTWTYYLRKGVKFHDGGEFTADDVKFSYDLIVKEGSLNTSAFRLQGYVESVEIVNPYQIVFRTKPMYDLNAMMQTAPPAVQIQRSGHD